MADLTTLTDDELIDRLLIHINDDNLAVANETRRELRRRLTPRPLRFKRFPNEDAWGILRVDGEFFRLGASSFFSFNYKQTCIGVAESLGLTAEFEEADDGTT